MSAPTPRPRILCVDDEPNVLEGLALNLGRRFDTVTASSGGKGLELVARQGPFAAVVSDMRMPEMNGAEFLARVRRAAPDTVRMLLTGQSDLDAAIAAVNQGQIFRFLSKPCPPDQLVQALEAAVEQYRLVTAERELLEKTLMGSLETLADLLALTNPEAFGRAMRVKKYVSELAAALELPDRWQVEAAAMLSQIGCVTLDAETVVKLNRGQVLSVEEERMAARVPQVTEQLLAHIPRLEGVRAILAEVGLPGPKAAGPAPTSDHARSARLLRVALDFDRLDARGLPLDQALGAMRSRGDRYDGDVLEVFGRLRAEEGGHGGVEELPLRSIKVGMIFAEDVYMQSKVLLAARGYVVTEAFIERARNFHSGSVREPIRCVRPAESKAA